MPRPRGQTRTAEHVQDDLHRMRGRVDPPIGGHRSGRNHAHAQAQLDEQNNVGLARITVMSVNSAA